MSMFFYAFLLGFLVSSVPPLFSEKEGGSKIVWTLLSLVGNIILAGIAAYFFMPVGAGPLGGLLNLWPVFLINAIVGGAFVAADSNDNHHMIGVSGSSIALALILIIFVVNGVGGWIGRDRERFAYSNVETKPISEMPWGDNNPKPVVSEGNAKTLFSGALPQSTSTGRPVVGRYKLGDVVKQEINGHIYWLGMLTYNSDFAGAWDESIKMVPGYMIVDAEDTKSKAQWVDYEINYFSGGFFGRDTHRLLYFAGYPNYVQVDPTIEKSDEDGKLYETIGLAKYNFSVLHLKIEKIAIIDVTTGNIFQVCDLGTCPDWIDRQVDDTVATDAVTWFGWYMKDDWFNPSGRDTFKADDVPVFVYSPETGKEFQFLMTSTSSADNTATGVLYYKTDSMKGVYYQVSGDPFPLGNQVVDKIQQNAVISVSKYMVDQMLLINISGHWSWLATLSTNNPPYGTQYQGVAYVLATSSPDVTSVDVQFDKDPAMALVKYQAWLKRYENGARGTLTGHVTDVGVFQKDGNSVFTMFITDDNTGQMVTAIDPTTGVNQPVFFTVVVGNDTREITMTQPGDQVQIEYYSSTWNEYIVTKLDNLDRPKLSDLLNNALKAFMGLFR